MSANLPPSFKPIAHYIKIANENASRDPVIYYWSLLWMVVGSASSAPSSSAPSYETPPTKFEEESWRRLQKAINVEKDSTRRRDELRDSIEDPDEVMRKNLDSERITVEIEEKRVKCEEMREKIQKLALKISNSRRKIVILDEKLALKEEEEKKLERKVQVSEGRILENLEKKEKEKRIISIMVRLNSHRKLAMLEEIFAIFRLKIDGGPASSPPAPRHCQCQVVDTIRGLHLPQLTHLFQHPEAATHAALQISLHLFDVICRVLNYAPKFSTETLMGCIQKPWKKRADRERFADSLLALGKNIGQLRETCGIPTMATDRTLGTLEEWIRFIDEKKAVFERPVESAFSPANLMIDMMNIL